MLAFFRSLLAEILPQKPKTRRRRSLLDRSPPPQKQEPVTFGRRGRKAPDKTATFRCSGNAPNLHALPLGSEMLRGCRCCAPLR